MGLIFSCDNKNKVSKAVIPKHKRKKDPSMVSFDFDSMRGQMRALKTAIAGNVAKESPILLTHGAKVFAPPQEECMEAPLTSKHVTFETSSSRKVVLSKSLGRRR